MELTVNESSKWAFFEINNPSNKIDCKFPFGGKVAIVRVIGKKEGFYNRFNKIKIGNKVFTETDGLCYMNPSSAYAYKVQDYLFESAFKKEDEFVFEHNDCVEKVQLFLSEKIN